MEEKTDFLKVPWKIKDALIVLIFAWIGLPLLILAILQIASVFIPGAQNFINEIKNEKLIANLILILINALGTVFIIRHFLKTYNMNWGKLGLKKFNTLSALGYILLGFVILGVLVTGIYWLVQLIFPHFNANQPQINEFTKAVTPIDQKISLLSLVIIPAFVEEIVFRGFVFPVFSVRFGLFGGIMITSILFGLAHFQFNVIIYTLILSLILCMMYYKLRSIWPGIIFHMLNNYLAYMAIMHK